MKKTEMNLGLDHVANGSASDGFSGFRTLSRNHGPKRPRVELIDGRKTLVREESWGDIYYDFGRDQFSAVVDQGGDDVVPAAPLGAYWLVSAPCNLKCIHCYGNVEELPLGNLSTPQQLSIVNRIIDSGVMRLTIAGGEPLLRKDTPQIIETLSDFGIAVVLGTNGTFLHDGIISSIKRANLVEISFDSHLENVNNAIRVSRAQNGNAYRESLTAIDLCVKSGVKLRVLSCLNSYNYKHVVAIADMLYARGVRDWGVSWTVRAGRAKAIFEKLIPDHQDVVHEQIEEVKSKYPDMRIKYSNRSDPTKFNRFSFLIFPDGRAFAEDVEQGIKVPFQSLLEQPLLESWNEENFNIRQHFQRWTAGRVYQKNGGSYV